MSNLLNAYTPLPISFEYGSACWLFDKSGNQYLDLIAGMGVTILGHANTTIINAINKQSKKLLHVSNLVQIPEQTILADMLADLCSMPNAKMFFTNSGAESIELVIKLTRLYGHSRKINNPKIVVMENAYHGRTIGSLSATGNLEYQRGFEPLLDCFIRIPFNDVNAVKNLAASIEAQNIVAVLLEPIQGEAGIRIPNDDYLQNIRQICSKNHWLMMVDEIQTGLGRTGKLFCYQHYNIVPDVIAIAKGLANGIPIGACIINQPFADLFKPRSHGSTFGGNPLSCSVAIATLQEIISNDLYSMAARSGNYFLNKLKKELANINHVVDIRAKGLMIGIELDTHYPDLMITGLKHGLLFNVTRNKIIRMLPPLIITEEQIDLAVNKLKLIIQKL